MPSQSKKDTHSPYAIGPMMARPKISRAGATYSQPSRSRRHAAGLSAARVGAAPRTEPPSARYVERAMLMSAARALGGEVGRDALDLTGELLRRQLAVSQLLQ